MKKLIKELAIIGAILGVLYITGLHTEVAGVTQKIILGTGLLNADSKPVEAGTEEDFDYSQVIRTMEGEDISMEEFRGKVIFLNIWASWCGPCRAEMPGIEELYGELRDDKDIAFVMLSVDRRESAAHKFMKRMKFDFPSYTMGGPLTDQLRVPSVPTTFVISPSGKIIKKKVGMARYNTRSFKNFLIESKEKS